MYAHHFRLCVEVILLQLKNSCIKEGEKNKTKIKNRADPKQ